MFFLKFQLVPGARKIDSHNNNDLIMRVSPTAVSHHRTKDSSYYDLLITRSGNGGKITTVSLNIKSAPKFETEIEFSSFCQV